PSGGVRDPRADAPVRAGDPDAADGSEALQNDHPRHSPDQRDRRDEPVRRSAAPRRLKELAALGAMQNRLISRREFLCGAAAGTAAPGLAGAAPRATRTVAGLAALKEALENTANPGDVLLLQPGVYRLDVRRLPARRSGTPERPITLRGMIQDGRRPVLDGS